MVKEEWRGLSEVQFTKKLKALMIPLNIWHKEKFGDINLKVQQLEDEIKKMDDLAGDGVYDGTMEARRRPLVSFSSARRRNNRIDALVISGRLVRNQARIKSAIRYFYKNLYHQEASPLVGIRDGLVNKIQKEDTADLERMPSADEIKKAVWDCESSKAPGCDGYNMNFIKKCWGEIGTEFTAAVMDFFQSAMLPRDSNVTWVVLAPKFVGAREIRDLWPISMVGCVYKVISKVLVRRMRRVMPDLVGETPSAFVQGRKIHDGALIACETV
nr:uncharacterized protein LOC114924634 [Arachis hypogaea]